MDASSAIGRTLAGRFRISRSVREDAFGWRFAARDRQSRKQVSVLLLRPEIVTAHAETLQTLGDALQAVQHPNVVRLLHHHVEGREGVRVTEWDAGGTLGGALSETPLVWSSVRWCQDVAEALVAAHAHGVLHGGIAPNCIHLVRRKSPPDQARLDDWGLAELLHTSGDPLTSTGLHFIGGAPWLAPEIIQRQSIGPPADLYALGCVLFHALTGRPPFSGPELKVLAAHVHDPPPAPSQHISGIPLWLDELVLDLLAKDPAARPQVAAEVVERLAEGAAQLVDGAAHPDHVTANVAPTRLPTVALRGTAAHAPPRVDRLSEDPPTRPDHRAWLLPLLLGAALGLAFGLLFLWWR